MTNIEIIHIFEDIFFEDDYVKTSRLHNPEFGMNSVGNTTVTLYGGLNGWGNCKDYLYDLYELIEGLETNGIDGYIVEFSIDPLDDVFKVVIELRDLKELTSENPE